MSVSGIALVEAVLARMCVGTREDGTVIQANYPNGLTYKHVRKQHVIRQRLGLK